MLLGLFLFVPRIMVCLVSVGRVYITMTVACQWKVLVAVEPWDLWLCSGMDCPEEPDNWPHNSFAWRFSYHCPFPKAMPGPVALISWPLLLSWHSHSTRKDLWSCYHAVICWHRTRSWLCTKLTPLKGMRRKTVVFFFHWQWDLCPCYK